MKLYIVIGIYNGVLSSVEAFEQPEDAEASLKSVQAQLEIEPGLEAESNNAACMEEVESIPGVAIAASVRGITKFGEIK